MLHMTLAAAALLPFKLVAQASLAIAAGIFIFEPSWRAGAVITVLIIQVLSRMHKEWHTGWQQHGHRSLLLIGCGNVGAGIGLAFAENGWQVITIDPCEALVPPELRTAPHAYDKVRIEDVDDDSLALWVATCREVVFAADSGNRDTYAADPALGPRQIKQFETFCRRLSAARGTSGCRLRYIGGSWTRREPDDALLVVDNSPAKPEAACNPYERSKTQACEAARELSAELGLPITFCDWASVVPNYAPNFSVAKMAEEALRVGTIGYSAGDFGRPVCHTSDAGAALLALCEDERRHYEAQLEGRPAVATPLFSVVLVPGAFTSFERFAEAARDEVEQQTGRRPALVAREGDAPPLALRSRCESERLAALGWRPDASKVEQGLRDACARKVKAAEPEG